MSSTPSAQHEPTMEEILASIRKIISEDSPDGQQVATTENAVVEDDVLDLTQEVEAPAALAEDVPAAFEIDDVQASAENAPDMPLPDMSLEDGPLEDGPLELDNDVVFEEIEEPVMSQADDFGDDDGIFSNKSRAALEQAFAELDEAVEEEPAQLAPLAAPALSPVSGETIQAAFERAIKDSFTPLMKDHLEANTDTIVAHMKPLIREWMDDHFPALLEGAVRDEVARVVKARGRR